MLEILNREHDLIERISQREVLDINEKLAIFYLFEVLSANMLEKDEYNQYMEANTMLVNPRERYYKDQGHDEGFGEGKLEVAKNLLSEGFPIERIVELTGLSKKDILKEK